MCSQFSINIISNLTDAGIPSEVAHKIAPAIASAGTLASRARFPGKLPISVPVLHTLVGISFTDAIHAGFIVSDVALLSTAVLSVLLLGKVEHQVIQLEIPAQDIAPVEVGPGVRLFTYRGVA